MGRRIHTGVKIVNGKLKMKLENIRLKK